MKRILFLLTITVLSLSGFVSFAKGQEDTDKVKFIKEFREYKHRFLAKQLDLTKEQEAAFFEEYDKMEAETDKVAAETRELERKIAESTDDVSDLEYDTATDAIFELKIKEGEIEKSYLDKFRSILTKKQLFLLKSAERNFNKELVQHQHRLHTAKHAKN